MANRPEKGDNAPIVSLPATDDQTITLGKAEKTGQIIFFYPRDNTPGCTTEAKEFSARKAEFEALGYSIVGVSKDSLRKHANFVAKQELTVDLASDENSDACEQYGVWVEKSMYGRVSMGIERSTFIVGADGTLKAVWRKVRVKGHVDTVFETVESLTG